MIELVNLKKNFGSKQVLRGVNLKVETGKIVSIIGGSGSGKSTTIKCIIRLLKPDGGQILVEGKDVTNITGDLELAAFRKNFGFLFQEGALFDSLSVGENVAFPLRYSTNTPKEKYAAVVKEKLAMAGLEQVEDLRPSELSGGMRKRVALARVLAKNPRCILYDEPTSGLDPIMSDIISDLILEMKQKLKVTSIVITHDMKSALKISDTIAFLYEGQIIFLGTPEEIQKSDNPYVKQFVEGTSKGPIKMKLTKD